MKKKIILSIIIFSLMIVSLTACKKSNDNTSDNSFAKLPAQITDLSEEQMKNLKGSYTENNTDFPLTHTEAVKLYKAVNPSEFKALTDEYTCIDNLKEQACISFWLFSDESDLKGSHGYYSIYEDNTVLYTLSPGLSLCEYYQASDGAYKAVKKIIEK